MLFLIMVVMMSTIMIGVVMMNMSDENAVPNDWVMVHSGFGRGLLGKSRDSDSTPQPLPLTSVLIHVQCNLEASIGSGRDS